MKASKLRKNNWSVRYKASQVDTKLSHVGSLSKNKDDRLMNNTYQDSNQSSQSNVNDIQNQLSSFPNMNQPKPSMNAVLKGILQKTFKQNHHEDLKLSSLNYAQRKYLRKIIKNDHNQLPFKMPYRDEDSETKGSCFA